jgi:quercetin dioxygenase-like cupin family protein
MSNWIEGDQPTRDRATIEKSTGINSGANTENINQSRSNERATAEAAHPSYVRNPQEGTALCIGTLHLTVKARGVETGGRFSLVEISLPPYCAASLLHLHRQTTEAIYLLQGMLAMTLGEETMVVRQGSSIVVAPHQVHRLWNPTAAPAIYLAYFTPAGVEEYFEALAELGLTETREMETTESPFDLAKVVTLAAHYDYLTNVYFATDQSAASSPISSD